MKVDVRGLCFEVYVAGPDNGAPVLLLHGFPQHAGEWDQVAPGLHAAGYRTIAPNQRGYTPDARPDDWQDYKMTECVADALAIVDKLVPGPVDVVGHDWGALVGWHLASMHPDRVRTLTAVSVPHPLAIADAMRDDPEQRERLSYLKLFRNTEKAEQVLLDEDARRLREMFDGVPEDLVDGYLRPLLEPGGLTGPLSWYRARSRADEDGIGPARVPTTFVWGEEDPGFGPVAARRCRAHVVGDYRFVPLADTGHWIPDQAPQQLTAAILHQLG